MRTVLFLVSGVLLLAAALILAKLFSSNHPEAPRIATYLFLAAWLLLAGFNMWVGVARAGYSVAEELPIFLVIFGLPAAAVILIKWRLF